MTGPTPSKYMLCATDPQAPPGMQESPVPQALLRSHRLFTNELVVRRSPALSRRDRALELAAYVVIVLVLLLAGFAQQ